MERKELFLSGAEITRMTTCNHFVQRNSILPIEHVCWFCRYAKFDLSLEKLPENGICGYPSIQIV